MKKIAIAFLFLISCLFSSDKTVAFVGNSPVLESEVYQVEYMERVPYNKSLERVIDRKLIFEKAKKEEIEVTEEEVEKELAGIKSSFPDEKDFYTNLEKSGLTISELKDILREKIMVRKFIEKKIVQKINISPSEIADFMSRHSEITKYNFRFKWFKSKEEANKFLINPDKEQMEEAGYLEENEILPEILKNLKKIKKGEFSKTFKIGDRFIVIYRVDSKKEKVKDISELYFIARKTLYNKKFNKLYKDLISRLKKEIPVEVNK